MPGQPAAAIDLVEIITEINESLSRPGGVSSNIRAAVEALRSGLEMETVFVLLLDPEINRLTLVAAGGVDLPDFRRLDSRVDRTPLRDAFDKLESLQINNIAADPRLAFLGPPESTLLSIPILQKHEGRGVLAAVFQDRTSVPHIKKILTLTASMIAQALGVETALRGERQKLIEENSLLKNELKEKYDFSHIIGNSGAMKQVYEQVTQVAKSNATVLLRGESGTGKELIAGAIHYNSLRSRRPFVKINCAALPDTLIEAELFGYEKGAFTGAEKRKKGRFEMADGGTLFLDEIGDLPLQTQVKLLRVLQEREFERLGGTETIKANIRLITATNKKLEELVAKGLFREDLYYRLNVFTIHLPPLRDRKSDILLLAEHFLEKYELEHGKRIRRISTPAIDMLSAYHYPGNVRELENAIERAVLVCDSNVVHGHHLPPTLQTAEVSGTETRMTLESAVAAFERDFIQDALKSSRGNIAKAARQLDSTERILGYKIRKYGINVLRFK